MSDIPNGSIRAEGSGAPAGGDHPDPPLDDHPLLVWVGGEVRTEDGRASVRDLAADYEDGFGVGRLAARHGTTADHAAQAVRYASEAGVLAVRPDRLRDGQWVKFRASGLPREARRARDGRYVGIVHGDEVRAVRDDRTDAARVPIGRAEGLAPVLDVADLPRVVRGTLPAGFRLLP